MATTMIPTRPQHTSAKPVKMVPVVFLFLFFGLLLVPALAKHYTGHGISFDYPEKYTITNKPKGIVLHNGPNSLSIDVSDFVFPNGFEDAVIHAAKNSMLKKAIQVTSQDKEEKIIPLQVKDQFGQIYIDAVKYMLSGEMVRNDARIIFYQTLFFFSYAEHGYIVTFNRTQANDDDLVRVLSTFTFDTREQEISQENAGVY